MRYTKVGEMVLWQDNLRTLYQGDARMMAELYDESVQCVVTSPPYWGLRKYAGEQDLIWGGRIGCEHEWQNTAPRRAGRASDIINLQSKEAINKGNLGIELPFTNTCSLCGAWRGAFGLEPTPGMYVQHTVEILREIKRVLRKDGVVFWNIGDSYASGKGTCFNPGGGRGSYNSIENRKSAGAYPLNRGNVSELKISNLKPKDLCLIPFHVAIAAQEDGWWVRSVIIWSKNNPMPESVTDRPTESHEYILMLTKSARYYWDAEAAREAYTEPIRWGGETLKRDTSKTSKYKEMQHISYSSAFRVGRPMRPNENGRNLRSVWTFPTQPYKDAHFATFPQSLPERCIKVATPEAGCCAECGAPWVRVIEKKMGERHESEPQTIGSGRGEGGDRSKHAEPTEIKTIGWRPLCQCRTDKPQVPSIVLDPFAGSGTTLKVAAELGRLAVGYELSEEYIKLAIERNRQAVFSAI